MSLIMKPRVVPVGAGLRSVDDTVKSCGSIGRAYRYCHAQSEPNYPVPAIKYKVVRGGRSSPFLTIVNRSLPVRQVVCWWEGVKAYRIR